MLVYGDHSERSAPARYADLINRAIAAAEHKSGLERHVTLISALVDAGRLLQGVADADFAEQHLDRRTPASEQLGRFLLSIGRAVCRSWDGGFAETVKVPQLQFSDDWPSEIEIRQPEGYAFYALYPEAYIEAARRLRLVAAPCVIGLRSIGTSLAAVVAAAVDAPTPVTLRPFGDPAARQVAVHPDLARELLGKDGHYIIVDEGPGQSGSSFGAVADWLRDRGVPLERIALLPSHDGAPGAAATAERRAWWSSVQREVGDLGSRSPQLIGDWCATALGPLDGPLEEISGGWWRHLSYRGAAEWPAAVAGWERRKFLVRAGGERFLAKFAGLGSAGQEKLAIARRLFEERLVPEPVALVHGFLIERWCADAEQLSPSEKPVAEVARYIGTRARLLPAMRGSGATVEQLIEMIRRNVEVEFGREPALDAFARQADDLERRMVRVRTDNKLDRQEWLRGSTGALIKTDALDHHQGHDLIGCQDLAWDVAGAVTELGFDEAEAERLCDLIGEDAGRSVDPQLLDFYTVAYLAFRLGQMRLGLTMVSDAFERQRIERRGDRYAAELQHLLQRSTAATRHESLVG